MAVKGNRSVTIQSGFGAGSPECRAGGVEQLHRVCPQSSGNVTSGAALGAELCLMAGGQGCAVILLILLWGFIKCL